MVAPAVLCFLDYLRLRVSDVLSVHFMWEVTEAVAIVKAGGAQHTSMMAVSPIEISSSQAILDSIEEE